MGVVVHPFRREGREVSISFSSSLPSWTSLPLPLSISSCSSMLLASSISKIVLLMLVLLSPRRRVRRRLVRDRVFRRLRSSKSRRGRSQLVIVGSMRRSRELLVLRERRGRVVRSVMLERRRDGGSIVRA